MGDIEELREQAEQVRNATERGENTAERVGGLFFGIVEEIDKSQQGVEQAIERANAAADMAESEAGHALQASMRANVAAQNAEDAVQDARGAASSANDAATLAEGVAAQANTAADAANDAARKANAATAGAEKAMEDTGEFLEKSGEDLRAAIEVVQGVGASVEAMGQEAKQQGDYAKAQGDYAKQQGDAIRGSIENIMRNIEEVRDVAETAVIAFSPQLQLLGQLVAMGVETLENANKVIDGMIERGDLDPAIFVDLYNDDREHAYKWGTKDRLINDGQLDLYIHKAEYYYFATFNCVQTNLTYVLKLSIHETADGEIDQCRMTEAKKVFSVDETEAKLSELEVKCEGNAETIAFIRQTTDMIDYKRLPLLCGQPMMIFGAGTPQEAIVPTNWKQYDPATGEGYQWNGLPSALGQVYINTSANTNGRYTAVPNGFGNLKWVNF